MVVKTGIVLKTLLGIWFMVFFVFQIYGLIVHSELSYSVCALIVLTGLYLLYALKEVELNKDGCEIRVAFIKISYTWEEIAYRKWFDFSRAAPTILEERRFQGQYLFSCKRGPLLYCFTKLIKAPHIYSILHPFSSFNIHYLPEQPKEIDLELAVTSVAPAEFADFVNEIGLHIEFESMPSNNMNKPN